MSALTVEHYRDPVAARAAVLDLIDKRRQFTAAFTGGHWVVSYPNPDAVRVPRTKPAPSPAPGGEVA